MRKKIVSLILFISMLAMLFAGCAAQNSDAVVEKDAVPTVNEATEQKPEENSISTIQTIKQDIVIDGDTQGQMETIVYIPNGLASAGPSTPIFLVYGDTAIDELGAETAIERLGLEKLATTANASVALINPIEETWNKNNWLNTKSLHYC